MLRLFLYSKIHAKYRKPIDIVGNIVYDDVVRFEQTRSKEVAQDAEPELSERLCGNRMRRSRTKQYGRVLRFAYRSAEAHRR